MKKCILGIILVFTLVLGTGITAFGRQPQPREIGAYAAPEFTLNNVLIYDNIEIMSVMSYLSITFFI